MIYANFFWATAMNYSTSEKAMDSYYSNASSKDYPSTYRLPSANQPETISELTNALRQIQTQVDTIHQDVASLRAHSAQSTSKALQTNQINLGGYAPSIRLAFQSIKWFFLFLIGFAVVFIFSATLGGRQISELLLSFLTPVLIPVAIVTFCTVAVVVIFESLK